MSFLCVPVHMETKGQGFFLNVAPLFLRQSLSGAYQFSYAGQQAPESMELATILNFFMWRPETNLGPKASTANTLPP